CVGAEESPMPTPTTTSGRSRWARDQSPPIAVRRATPRAAIAHPPRAGRRGPYLSASQPAAGPSSIIGTDIAASSRPTWPGGQPRTPATNSGTARKTVYIVMFENITVSPAARYARRERRPRFRTGGSARLAWRQNHAPDASPKAANAYGAAAGTSGTRQTVAASASVTSDASSSP